MFALHKFPYRFFLKFSYLKTCNFIPFCYVIKSVTKKRTNVNKVCDLPNPLVLTFILSIPSNKLPWSKSRMKLESSPTNPCARPTWFTVELLLAFKLPRCLGEPTFLLRKFKSAYYLSPTYLGQLFTPFAVSKNLVAKSDDSNHFNAWQILHSTT